MYGVIATEDPCLAVVAFDELACAMRRWGSGFGDHLINSKITSAMRTLHYVFRRSFISDNRGMIGTITSNLGMSLAPHRVAATC